MEKITRGMEGLPSETEAMIYSEGFDEGCAVSKAEIERQAQEIEGLKGELGLAKDSYHEAITEIQRMRGRFESILDCAKNDHTGKPMDMVITYLGGLASEALTPVETND